MKNDAAMIGGLSHFAAKDETCSECLANRTTRPYTDLQRDAKWRPTQDMPLVTYKARIRIPLHPLAKTSSLQCVFLGLHAHHGLQRCRCYCLRFSFVAACAKSCTWKQHGGPPQTHQRRDANMVCCSTRTSLIATDKAKQFDKPWLGQSTWACDQSCQHSCCLWCFADLAVKYLSDDDEFEKQMLLATKSLHQLYSNLDAAPRFPSYAQLARIRRVCVHFGASFMWCREHARRIRFMPWEATPTVHKSQHLPKMCEVMNPRFS